MSFLQTNVQRLLKTLELCALEKKELVKKENLFIIKDQDSIELYLILWLKEVILLPEMELEENQFTERNSLMKTSLLNIQEEEIYQWQMLDQTQMVHNSSWHLFHVIGLMENTQCLEKFTMVLKFLMLLKVLDHNKEKHQNHVLFQTLANLMNEYTK